MVLGLVFIICPHMCIIYVTLNPHEEKGFMDGQEKTYISGYQSSNKKKQQFPIRQIILPLSTMHWCELGPPI
jgi:hypothetical protein